MLEKVFIWNVHVTFKQVPQEELLAQKIQTTIAVPVNECIKQEKSLHNTWDFYTIIITWNKLRVLSD